MNKKALALLGLSTIIYLIAAPVASANYVPNFGTCLNPQWSQTQVNYNANPEHGVIGVGSFAGTDTIYESNGNVMQCLCTNSGAGYQTNWLKASGLSQYQIDDLKTQGWIYIPDGSEGWGLDKGPYMAKNISYTCTACTPTPTVSETPTPTVTPTAGPTETPTPGPSATPTSAVGAASANNLAGTGSSLLIYASLLAGAASLILGMIIRKLNNK